MGMVMTRCPVTGRQIATGVTADRVSYRAMPVFFALAYCRYCKTTHEWFARDGWVCELLPPIAPAPHRSTHRAR
jgi:hypothetical protein